MNKRSIKLKAVTELKRQREQNKLTELARGRSLLYQEQQKLAQLQEYFREYQLRLSEQGKACLGARQWQQQQLFINWLRKGIKQQQLVVEERQQHCRDIQAEWKVAYQQASSMDILYNQTCSEEQAEHANREQKLLDDITLCRIARDP